MLIKQFHELTLKELYAILKLRQDVFVCEQNCAFHDIDGKDQNALHLIQKQQEEIQAYARLIFDLSANVITISRIVTPLSFRNQGIGKTFITKVMSHLMSAYSAHGIRIDAQSRLEPFYEKFGFKVVGPEFFFESDPMPHMPMEYVQQGKVRLIA